MPWPKLCASSKSPDIALQPWAPDPVYIKRRQPVMEFLYARHRAPVLQAAE
jgi:hypothetical protein